jgi:hypothetical protein
VAAKSTGLFLGVLAKMQFLLSWIDHIPGALKVFEKSPEGFLNILFVEAPK